ncbi:MAG: alpha-L-fucosidase [Victivallales bacterium]|nr:alpha-L-fucosidase [Victivallales bacterium]
MYEKSDTDWLAKCAIGISMHWTAKTAPRSGEAQHFQKAVEAFNLDDFLGAVEASEADYLIFTSTHALQMLPAPSPVIDNILPGRATERDLLGEIAKGISQMDKKFIVYYNHSCNNGDDPEWERAVGYHDKTIDRLLENLTSIVEEMGERYGELVQSWWFDSGYSLDPSGPSKNVTTPMLIERFPWEILTEAAKKGYSQRLVTYNAGVAKTFLYTDHQDYWAGELTDLKTPPISRYAENGLQWHGWTCLDDSSWVYDDNSIAPSSPRFNDDEIIAFVRECRANHAPMCFNVTAFQDGSLLENSVMQLARINKTLK